MKVVMFTEDNPSSGHKKGQIVELPDETQADEFVKAKIATFVSTNKQAKSKKNRQETGSSN